MSCRLSRRTLCFTHSYCNDRDKNFGLLMVDFVRKAIGLLHEGPLILGFCRRVPRRHSSCELEIDSCVEDVANRKEVFEIMLLGLIRDST